MLYLSIIVPAYKRVEQTLKTIELLIGSRGYGKEFNAEIIVADSSPDDELKNAIKIKFNDSIVYTRPDKEGIATNKNQGAKIARHSILIFCDSDMEVEPNTLFNTIKSFKEHQTAAAIGGQVIWKGGNKDGQHDRPRKEDRMITQENTTYIEAIYSRYIAMYKEVFDGVGGYDEEVFNMRGEGSDLSVRLWRAGYPLVYDESIIVHHVYDAPDSIALRIDHPEWGIAKDLLLLAYKYDISDEKYTNFVNTVAANFKPMGDLGFYTIIEGIARNMDLIQEVKPLIDKKKLTMKAEYDFKFLEIFSDGTIFKKCILNSINVLDPIRKKVFYEKT